MKILQLAVMSAAVLTAGSLFAQDLKALEEHVTFQMSFEGSVEVDRAEGEIKLQQGKHEDVQSGYSYVDGVRGKALYNTDPKGHVRRHLMKDNINFDLPGTVSLWVKPVAWKKLTADSPKQKNGRYNTITTPFFMTGWCRTGYIVLERACPEFLNRPEQVRLLFPGFKNIRSYYSKEFKWEDNKWYHIVMTWSGYNYTVYINGEVVLAAAHKEKLKQSDMHRNFEIRPNAGMTLDEFTIYNKALNPAEIKALYNSMKK